MSRIAVVTDSNSGITQAESKELGVFVIPMPFFINEKHLLEDIDLSQEEFYTHLSEESEISTSQPSPADVMDMWKEALEEYDEVVHIPMSSGLSAACGTAMGLAQEFDGKVQVVDNQRISITQRQSVLDAMYLAEQGKNAVEIKEILEKEKMESSIYLMVETLKYLKKGGRITPAAAALGTLLNLKPVLQIQGEKLDAYAKTRGKVRAKKIMIQAVKDDLEKRFKEYVNPDMLMLHGAYAGNKEEAEIWKQELEAEFPGFEIEMYPLSLSVTCHTGPGVLAVGCAKKVQ